MILIIAVVALVAQRKIVSQLKSFSQFILDELLNFLPWIWK